MKLVVEKKRRIFVPDELNIQGWSDLQPFFDNLRDRDLPDVVSLRHWLLDVSELEAVVEENAAWRYIRMTVDTSDAAATTAYETFIKDIQPHMAPYGDVLNKKLAQHPDAGDLEGSAFRIYLRGIRNAIRIFREKNIPIQTELQSLAQQYSAINGSMQVELDGETFTMQAASAKLQNVDRNYRERVFRAVDAVRATHVAELDRIFDAMVALRDELSRNADHPDYRSYMFASLGRFDYTIQDCLDFHDSIEREIVPLAKASHERRLLAQQIDALRPWDLAVDPEGRAPLRPFTADYDLLNKSIAVFDRIDPFFGDCLRSMHALKQLDLGSKPGKAPGGYNYPLYETGLPFIFMNAVGTQRDLVTMMHEGGHAVHSVLSHPLELTSFKSCPSEVAELASMSMELISMDHWDLFYDTPEDTIRAKREHLEDLLVTLPWIARIDAFQHWLYTNPQHDAADRAEYWLYLGQRFGTGVVDFSGFDLQQSHGWQRQLHLFEVPFYYIEYAMAQLGAIAVWRNYKLNREVALAQFKKALSLGYTRPIGEIYAAAGIDFDFSPLYLKQLAKFVNAELQALT